MPGLGTLARGLRPTISKRRSQLYLTELNSSDSQSTSPLATRRFQYFPESFSDSKATNYQTKEVMGASLPLYQYTGSGERTISFTAVFSTDVDHMAGATPATALQTGNVPPNVAAMNERTSRSGVEAFNVWIPGAIAWLRRFLYPTYGGGQSQVGTPLTRPPAKLLLTIPGTYFNIESANVGPHTANTMMAIMTQCEVTYEALFPSGNPRYATVQLAFAQVAQYGGNIAFPHAGSSGWDDAITAYRLQPVRLNRG